MWLRTGMRETWKVLKQEPWRPGSSCWKLSFPGGSGPSPVQPLLMGGQGATSYLPGQVGMCLPPQAHLTAPSFLPGGPEDHLSRLPRHVNRTRLITCLSLPRATENYFYIIGFFNPWYISREFLSKLPEHGGGSLLIFLVGGFPGPLHH